MMLTEKYKDKVIKEYRNEKGDLTFYFRKV